MEILSHMYMFVIMFMIVKEFIVFLSVLKCVFVGDVFCSPLYSIHLMHIFFICYLREYVYKYRTTMFDLTH